MRLIVRPRGVVRMGRRVGVEVVLVMASRCGRVMSVVVGGGEQPRLMVVDGRGVVAVAVVVGRGVVAVAVFVGRRGVAVVVVVGRGTVMVVVFVGRRTVPAVPVVPVVERRVVMLAVVDERGDVVMVVDGREGVTPRMIGVVGHRMLVTVIRGESWRPVVVAVGGGVMLVVVDVARDVMLVMGDMGDMGARRVSAVVVGGRGRSPVGFGAEPVLGLEVLVRVVGVMLEIRDARAQLEGPVVVVPERIMERDVESRPELDAQQPQQRRDRGSSGPA